MQPVTLSDEVMTPCVQRECLLTACLKGMRSLSSEFLVCGATADYTCRLHLVFHVILWYVGSGKWNNDANAPATTFLVDIICLSVARFISELSLLFHCSACLLYAAITSFDNWLCIREYETSNFILPFQDCFGYSRPLKIPYEF